MTSCVANFSHPEDFNPVKGRAHYYYCKLCTPAGRLRGQPMSKNAALRHEADNPKHRAKAEAAHPVDAWDDNWRGYQPICDWEPTPIPEGSSAWEEAHPCDRVRQFIPWWAKGVAAADAGKEVEAMDAFIEGYNRGEWHESVEGKAAEKASEPIEEDSWDGVPGVWYTGGSFLPDSDGAFDDLSQLREAAPNEYAMHEIDADMRISWDAQEDPYDVWGISRDEITPWTPGDASSPSSGVTEDRSWRGQKQVGGAIVEAAICCSYALGEQQAKMKIS